MLAKSSAACTLLLLSGAIASPISGRTEPVSQTSTAAHSSSTPDVYDWSSGWSKTYPIHSSCNATLRHQLADGLDDLVQLAQHAKDHLLRFGSKSEFVQKYFGNASTSAPIGWYDRVITADKTKMLFRCDDPDGNCVTQKS